MARFDFRQKPFRLYGVPFFDSTGKLERVPEDVAKQCNDGVVTLLEALPPARRLRFCTDSRKISFRITLASIEPDIGMSIYSCQSGNVFIGSRYAGLVKPSGYDSVLCQGAFEKDAGMEDVTLFLPRNEPVAGIEIELDDGAAVEAPTPYAHAKPILFYGSSITEGGCCSKPANAYNALLSRWLDADYYNFGFSGSARGELAMADYITTIEKSVFVMDCAALESWLMGVTMRRRQSPSGELFGTQPAAAHAAIDEYPFAGYCRKTAAQKRRAGIHHRAYAQRPDRRGRPAARRADERRRQAYAGRDRQRRGQARARSHRQLPPGSGPAGGHGARRALYA